MENNKNQIIPFDKDLESMVLGSIISNYKIYNEIRDIVSIDAFYDVFHRNVFEIFKTIESQGETPDMILISRDYQKKFNEIKVLEIMELSSVIAIGSIYSHTTRLIELSARRKLIELGLFLQTNARLESEDVAEILTQANNRLENIFTSSENKVSTIKDAIKGVYDIIERNANTDSPLTGTPTGFDELDRKSGGFQTSDLIIIAAETSQGKTSLALSIANHAAICGESIAIYSLEMKKEQCAARLMSINSGIPANELLYSRISQRGFERLDKSITRIYNSKIYFDDRSTSNIDTIISSIRSMVLKYGIKGVIIDYLQILNVNMKGFNKEQQMADVARRLKNLAKDLDIWIVALSQLNRDSQNPIPNLNRLRDSGQIAEAADMVIFIYRPEVYNKPFPEPFEAYETSGFAMIDIAKGRNIGIFKILCKFDKQNTHFSHYDIHKMPLATKIKISSDPF